MTTLQAIAYAILRGFTEFLPVGASAHTVLVPYLLDWPEPTGALAGALALGSFLALLIYFRHDWASMISCFLQVVIFRKKPMTLDERMPIFLAIGCVPLAFGWIYLHPLVAEVPWTPLATAVALAGFGLPLWFAERMGRKSKGMFDWNWLDSLLVGVSSLASLVPGCGRLAAALPGSLLRGYSREAGAKFALFLSAPILAASAAQHLAGVSLHAAEPMEGVSWLSFWVALLVTTVFGVLAIGGFMRGVQRKGFGQFVVYRFLLAGATGAVWYFRTRS
jgi:undecaprenyl-diphosphatase